MPKTWQTQQLCSKYGKHANSVAIMLKIKRGKHGHSMAIKIKMLQTWPQCGNNTQNVANMINDMPNVHLF